MTVKGQNLDLYEGDDFTAVVTITAAGQVLTKTDGTDYHTHWA